MNERILEIALQAGLHDFVLTAKVEEEMGKFAELIVRECATIARDTDLEDVEGGDSAVLRAARNQILSHFGVE